MTFSKNTAGGLSPGIKGVNMGNIFFNIDRERYKMVFLPGDIARVENMTDSKYVLIPYIQSVKIKAFVNMIKWYKSNTIL